MFIHRGSERTHKHNLQIASLLSFVAGMVNVSGFLAVQRLTTNVTGHFAFFVDEVFRLEFWNAFVFFIYIFCFFSGSFISGLLIEILSKRINRLTYIIPGVLESVLLIIAAFGGESLSAISPDALACLLLFAMGLQNALVTNISNSVVRTTHLTGLFTDLGIELSQLFFYRQKDQLSKLNASIRLRLTIIGFFFLGGLLSGTLYSNMGLYTLLIAAGLLIAGTAFEEVRTRLFSGKRSEMI